MLLTVDTPFKEEPQASVADAQTCIFSRMGYFFNPPDILRSVWEHLQKQEDRCGLNEINAQMHQHTRLLLLTHVVNKTVYFAFTSKPLK